jgi:maleylacetoacetate isomerase
VELYSFFNSSTSQRVRIALQLKGVAHEYQGVNIRAGAHRDAYYLDNVNPAGLVPAVVDGDFRLGQSLAIIDWLDTRYPEPRLIPVESELRTRVLELSYSISCDMHPVNNLRILKIPARRVVRDTGPEGRVVQPLGCSGHGRGRTLACRGR